MTQQISKIQQLFEIADELDSEDEKTARAKTHERPELSGSEIQKLLSEVIGEINEEVNEEERRESARIAELQEQNPGGSVKQNPFKIFQNPVEVLADSPKKTKSKCLFPKNYRVKTLKSVEFMSEIFRFRKKLWIRGYHQCWTVPWEIKSETISRGEMPEFLEKWVAVK